MPKGNKNTIIHGGGVHHIAIQTRDLEASFRFYRDTLGMTLAAVFERPDRKIYLFDVGDGSCIELFPPPADKGLLPVDAGIFPVMHFAISTTNTRAAVEVVRNAGYTIRIEPVDLELGGQKTTIAFVTGPSGEDVEFFQVS
ncbi:MAG: VOC family protein [Verrucomicrobiota bacterium]|nr:VOC family protein [Verrucomicrobiota bacterium]